jgi:hypothetical protein
MRHFRPHHLPAWKGRSHRQGALLVRHFLQPSGDNGNMALNGAGGEDLGCGGLWLRGTGGSSLRQDLGPLCLSSLEVDDLSWEPPTEAETKVLQARRERQDRISRLMGDYLLRGYRMLGETCADCGVRRLRPVTGDGAVDQVARPFLSFPLWTLSHGISLVPRVLSGPQTILLQDKQRKIYCVACQELDSDVDKDNPGEGPGVPGGEAR